MVVQSDETRHSLCIWHERGVAVGWCTYIVYEHKTCCSLHRATNLIEGHLVTLGTMLSTKRKSIGPMDAGTSTAGTCTGKWNAWVCVLL